MGEDGFFVFMIFNNICGKNFLGEEYCNYIKYVVYDSMGLKLGIVFYYWDGVLYKSGIILKFWMDINGVV